MLLRLGSLRQFLAKVRSDWVKSHTWDATPVVPAAGSKPCGKASQLTYLRGRAERWLVSH